MKRRADADLAREIQTHLDLEADDRRADGLAAEDARRSARRTFGNVTLTLEETRAVWNPVAIDQLRQDIQYGWRVLQRSPGFAMTAILSIALAVGANTIVFSVLNAALFRPITGTEPERLRFVSANVSYPNYRDLRERLQTIEGAIAYRPVRLAARGETLT